MSNFKDLTGIKFGRLTVLSIDKERGEKYKAEKNRGAIFWKCRCDCGNLTTVIGNALKRGITKSCGCLMRESTKRISQLNRKTNKYKIAFKRCIVYSTYNNKFEFDVSDYENIKGYSWSENRLGYACTTITIPTSTGKRKCKKVFLHRLIMDAKEGEVIDHINRDFRNNKKSNLRKCTQAENARNISLTSRSKTGIIGVQIYKENRWRVRLRFDGKQLDLGIYTNKEDAIIARLKGEKEYYGEFAPQRHLFEEYGV